MLEKIEGKRRRRVQRMKWFDGVTDLTDLSFSLSISPSHEYSELISFRMDWFDLLEVQRALKNQVISSTTI